jgi:hypothetical protein
MAIMHSEIFFPFLWENKYKYLELLGKLILLYIRALLFIYLFSTKIYIFHTFHSFNEIPFNSRKFPIHPQQTLELITYTTSSISKYKYFETGEY